MEDLKAKIEKLKAHAERREEQAKRRNKQGKMIKSYYQEGYWSGKVSSYDRILGILEEEE